MIEVFFSVQVIITFSTRNRLQNQITLRLYITDCGSPSQEGYTLTANLDTTYTMEANVDTSCATGYTGTPDQSVVTCQASGTWTTATGCTVVGEYARHFVCFSPLHKKVKVGNDQEVARLENNLAQLAMHYLCISSLLFYSKGASHQKNGNMWSERSKNFINTPWQGTPLEA